MMDKDSNSTGNCDDDLSNGENDTSDDKIGSSPEDIAQMVKERKDRRDNEDEPNDKEAALKVIAQQDEDIDMLLAALEKAISENNGNSDSNDDDTCGDDTKEDCSDDSSKSLNVDSMDNIVRQRVGICRIGDKLNMDGLENMSIKQAKKVIIAKVLPNMRMDGKSDVYIDAMYDLAVGEVNKHKGVSYQKQQMAAMASKIRTDSNESMAAMARKNMIAREGGNE